MSIDEPVVGEEPVPVAIPSEVNAEPEEEPAEEAVFAEPAQATGMRQRKKSVAATHFEEGVDEIIPDSLKGHVKKLTPVVEKLVTLYVQVSPFIHIARSKLNGAYGMIKPYHPEEFLPVIVGLVMAFFGGNFIFLLAAVEAFRMVAYTQMTQAYTTVSDNYYTVKEQWIKDDGDDEASKTALAKRKALLVLRSVDPLDVGIASASFTAGLMAIMATLRLRLAKAITLGSTVGGILANGIYTLAGPKIKPKVSAEYQKWILPTIAYTCKILSIVFAWMFFRVSYAFQSSIRGAELCAKGLLKWADRQGYLKREAGISEEEAIERISKRKEFVLVVAVVALSGFMWQVTRGFRLPLPLNLILLPVTLLEYFVEYLVSWA